MELKSNKYEIDDTKDTSIITNIKGINLDSEGGGENYSIIKTNLNSRVSSGYAIYINGSQYGLRPKPVGDYCIEIRDSNTNIILGYGIMTTTAPTGKYTISLNTSNGIRYLNDPGREVTPNFHMLRFGVGGSNNSGGTFDMSSYLFQNSNLVVCTHSELVDASKYEKHYSIDGYGSYGWGKIALNPEWTKSLNRKLHIPGSADHWSANFYGYIIDPDYEGKNLVQTYRNVYVPR